MRYSNARLKQDLHCLQNLMIIHALHITIILIVELLLVRYSNTCLRLFFVILKDLHCLHRCYHNVEILNYTIIQISHLAGLSLVRYG